ncbi:hypothetical protein ABIE33_006368 [Ensifer sp. 4252]
MNRHSGLISASRKFISRAIAAFHHAIEGVYTVGSSLNTCSATPGRPPRGTGHIDGRQQPTDLAIASQVKMGTKRTGARAWL